MTTRTDDPRYRSDGRRDGRLDESAPTEPRDGRSMGETTIDDLTVAGVGPATSSSDVTPGAPAGSITKRQIRGSSLMLVGRFIALGINFAVQVLIVRYLSQTAYGAFAYALSLVALGETIVTAGLDRGVGRFLAVYDEQRDYGRLAGTLALVAGTVLSLGLAVVLVVVGLQDTLSGTYISDPQAAALLAILIVLAPIQAADNLLAGMLAVFASARAIFVRKYLVGPGLRLLVVGLLIAGQESVDFLAIGYVLSGFVGIALYAAMLWKVLGDRGIRTAIRRVEFHIPFRAIFAFTFPLLTTDLVYLAMNTTDAILLGHFWGSAEVASYLVVDSLVRLNTVVYSSFTLLFMPAASRLFARGERDGVADLYWRTAIWMAVLSFPIFALTTSLAGPVTVGLYQERYADSATYLALLSIAAYVNVALGFNGLTLRVYGFVRYTVAINLIAAVTSVGMNLLLIPPFGALGAAVATSVSLIAFNFLKQIGLRRGTGISPFDRRYVGVYITIVVVAVALYVVRLVLDPGLVLSIIAAGVASLVVLLLTRRTLAVAEAFPEILRLPFARRILGA